jgi:hypothetical protein
MMNLAVDGDGEVLVLTVVLMEMLEGDGGAFRR